MMPPGLGALLSTRYGLDARHASPLGGEYDENLLVELDKRRVIVKISPAGADAEQVRWQHHLLDALRDADVPPVPQLIAALDGAQLTTLDADGTTRLVRVHTYLAGRTVSDLNRHSADLLIEWGATAGRLVRALADKPQPSAPATHHWDCLRADESVAAHLSAVGEHGRRADVERIMGWFARDVAPVRAQLPRQVVHQDLNDFNVLASAAPDGRHHISGVLDFADALHTARVNELAVAMAYAMLRKPDPARAAALVAKGFLAHIDLTDAELAVAYPMAAARLCVNATTWTAREAHNGDYARARMCHTWPTIARLAQLPPALVHAELQALGGTQARTFAVPSDRAGPAPDLRGRHLTPRDDQPPPRRSDTDEPASLRLGVEVCGPLPLPVDGVVAPTAGAGLAMHHPREGGGFWTTWSPAGPVPAVGTRLPAGTMIGHPGRPLRVAAFTDGEVAACAPDAVRATAREAWLRVSPDPAPLLGVVEEPRAAPPPRAAHFARSQRAYYRDPPRFVGSRDVWLHDEHGLAYLDAMNNVTHVGHANPRVVRAMAEQAGRLNTNSRFVYDGIERYAARLAGLLPDPLAVVFLVCTGSEANDLALRIARQVTGRADIAVIDGAYHGNTGAVTDVSPNRYNGPGGAGPPPTTHALPQPNRYRGQYRYDDPQSGERYLREARSAVDDLVASDRAPAALLAESLMGTAGAITYPDGYLSGVYNSVRAAGGLCIADEVQVGFGRLGTHFWGFQTQGVVPDIVTMGKPIGNGHPMAAVVTTHAIAEAFDTGMKYFNTFGGNPVSCAVGEAVLDELEDRGLPQQAQHVGAHLHERLRTLMDHQTMIGDVRGYGLYLGVELVTDRATREPAGAQARQVCELMKDEGVLTYPTGPGENILKIKPPMTFTVEHADLFVDVLDGVLSADW